MASTEATIGSVYDVTKRVKEILIADNEKNNSEKVLIQLDKKGGNESLSSYFLRGGVSVIEGEVFDRERYTGADADTINTLYKQKLMDINASDIQEYEMQNVLYVIPGIFIVLLGKDACRYKAQFSNGKVCHLWKENINGVDHLCILSVEDSFTIKSFVDPDEVRTYSFPGTMMMELKIPVSIIQNKDPITEKYITRTLVTSEELYSLLKFNSDLISFLDHSEEEQKMLQKSLESFLEEMERNRKEPLQNFGAQIKALDFKETILKKRIILHPEQEQKPSEDNGIDSINDIDETDSDNEKMALSDNQGMEISTSSGSDLSGSESRSISPDLEKIEESETEDLGREDKFVSKEKSGSEKELGVQSSVSSSRNEPFRALSPNSSLRLMATKPNSDAGLECISTPVQQRKGIGALEQKEITPVVYIAEYQGAFFVAPRNEDKDIPKNSAATYEF